MFRLAFSSHIYFFVFRGTNRDTLVFLHPEAGKVAARVSGRKWVQSTEPDLVNGSFCNLCALALRLALEIFATQCWRAPIRAKQLSTVAILLYRFLSCWCLETFFHVVSALQSFASIQILFWLIRSLVDPMLAVFIVCGPLQLVTHLKKAHWNTLILA